MHWLFCFALLFRHLWLHLLTRWLDIIWWKHTRTVCTSKKHGRQLQLLGIRLALNYGIFDQNRCFWFAAHLHGRSVPIKIAIISRSYLNGCSFLTVIDHDKIVLPRGIATNTGRCHRILWILVTNWVRPLLFLHFFEPFENIFFAFFFVSFIVMYFILPETERRSLEDIERHYSDNTKGLADIHIRKKCWNWQNILMANSIVWDAICRLCT